ncbi:hypothetical protein ACKUVQ_10845 [Mycobacterium seoulense]|uniref:hypothetical protein n=1 Tax=Mycobacterium seoulense TaxID=386911 RepID=UPI003CF55D2A
MPEPPFAVFDVAGWEVAADEPAGQEEKLWLIQPDAGVKWLFKPPTEKNNFRQGEDWSEKVSSELARLISVPCAEVQLADLSGRSGSISRNLRPHRWEMQAGALLLAEGDPNYQPGSMNVKGRPGHSLDRIRTLLSGAGMPPEAGLPAEFSGFDVFAGFMVLDAWIANRDRHDENWSILLPPPDVASPRLLCASYDQAGGLGYNVRAEVCAQRLAQPDGVLTWVKKGTAYRFEYDPASGPITLVEHAMAALELSAPRARDFWMERLMDVTQDTVVSLLSRVPNLSDHCRRFAGEVLRINQRRLCDAYQQHFG